MLCTARLRHLTRLGEGAIETPATLHQRRRRRRLRQPQNRLIVADDQNPGKEGAFVGYVQGVQEHLRDQFRAYRRGKDAGQATLGVGQPFDWHDQPTVCHGAGRSDERCGADRSGCTASDRAKVNTAWARWALLA